MCVWVGVQKKSKKREISSTAKSSPTLFNGITSPPAVWFDDNLIWTRKSIPPRFIKLATAGLATQINSLHITIYLKWKGENIYYCLSPFYNPWIVPSAELTFLALENDYFLVALIMAEEIVNKLPRIYLLRCEGHMLWRNWQFKPDLS